MDYEDGIVEDVVEDEFLEVVPSESKYVVNALDNGRSLVQSYGWVIIVGLIVLYLLFIQIRKRFKNRANSRDSSRARSLEAARARQQAMVNAANQKRNKEANLVKDRKGRRE